MTTEKQRITEEDGIHEEWYKEAKEVTTETLPEFVRHLTEGYSHDYGTICHAVAAAALAAANAVNHSPTGGITGFQAGAVMWEFITNWNAMGVKKGTPMRLVDYSNLLYPQYEHKFQGSISHDTWEWLKEQASEELQNNDGFASSAVIQHWKSIERGIVPFGLGVEK